MKKLMFLMMALMVAPAMAAVTFSIVDNEDTTGSIWVTVSGADTVGGGDVYSLVAGIAIDVELSTGDMVAVTDYKGENFPTDPAESTAAYPGYGIYMGTIQFNGDPCEISAVGTPVAPYNDPGSVHDAAFPGSPSQVLTLEFGALYDVAVATDAPVLVTKLCTIEVSESGATLSITGGNATRGNVILKGGDASTDPNYGTGTVITGFEEFDFGDAPDPLVATAGKYPTLLANNGARHIIIESGNPFLGPEGDEPDDEVDGQPNAAATGDDIDLAGASGGDDEDGVTIGTLIAGDPAAVVTFEVNDAPTVPVYVDGWIDFNADGDWDDGGEKIVGATYTDGIYSPTFAVPVGAAIGTTYVRFRINTVGALGPDGEAADGEVEDHTVVIGKYTVEFIEGSNGTISGTLVQEIAHGGNCTAVDPDGNANYHFDVWSGDDTSTDDPLTITNVVADMTITANFAIDTYELTPTSTSGGSVTVPGEAGPYTYNYNTPVTLTAEAITDWSFVNWTGDTAGIDDVDAADTTVTMQADYDVQANFEEDSCYTGPDTAAWESRGEPSSWCYLRQCHGDADDAEEYIGRSWYRVSDTDITILLAGYKKAYPGVPSGDPPADPDTTHPWIAADFDHDTEYIGRSWYAVSDNDITVLLAWYKKTPPPADCQTGSPVDP